MLWQRIEWDLKYDLLFSGFLSFPNAIFNQKREKKIKHRIISLAPSFFKNIKTEGKKNVELWRKYFSNEKFILYLFMFGQR